MDSQMILVDSTWTQDDSTGGLHMNSTWITDRRWTVGGVRIGVSGAPDDLQMT